MKKIIKKILGVFRRLIILFFNVEYLIKGRLDLSDGVKVGKGSLLSLYKGGQIKIAKNTQIARFIKLASLGGIVEIGESCSIGDYCVLLGGEGGIFLGQKVMLADNVRIIAFNHIFEDSSCPISEQGVSSKGIKIGDGSWIGIGATILDGVTIGRNCVIGAASVVTSDIPSGAVVVGVPARIIKVIK